MTTTVANPAAGTSAAGDRSRTPNAAAEGAAAPTGRAARQAKRAKASGGRNPVIDGYRGIAAIGVVFGHAVLINQLIFNTAGRHAVYTMYDVLPMFFSLSGLMTYRTWVVGALSGKVAKRGPTIANRLWRIVPVYYTIVLAVWATRFVNSSADWSDLVLHLSFMQAWSPKYTFWLDGPSWFLADDLHFFLLATLVGPLLCQLALRIPLSRWGVAGRMLVMATLPIAMICGGCAYIWLEAYHFHHGAPTWTRYDPLYTMPEFAFGMLLGVIAFSPGVVKVRPKLSLVLTGAGLAALALVAYFSWRVDWMNIDNFGYPLIAVFCCVLQAGALMASPTGRFARVMGIKPLQFLASVGLTILLLQEPLMFLMEKWGFVAVYDPTAMWISATLLLCVAAAVAYVATVGIEQPALAFRARLARIRSLQSGGDRRHRGPIPRMLPDVVLELLSGDQLPVRAALGDRPLLLAFGEAGTGALAEQQFRINSGESRALHISPSLDRSAREAELLGAHIALDPDGTLSRALNIPVALVEVGPDGLITSFQRSRREALGAWT